MKVKYLDKVSLTIKGITYNQNDINDIDEKTYNTFKSAFEVIAEPKQVVEVKPTSKVEDKPKAK